MMRETTTACAIQATQLLPTTIPVGERRAVSGLKELAAGSRFRKQLIIHSGSESAGVRDFIHL